MGSNSLINVSASAPVLIVGGYYLQKWLGSKRCVTYWQVSLLSCFICLWAFGLHTEIFDYNLRQEYFASFRWDGVMDDSRRILAPDLMAACVFYMVLIANGFYYLTLALLVFLDLPYYGALALAVPLALFIFFKCTKP